MTLPDAGRSTVLRERGRRRRRRRDRTPGRRLHRDHLAAGGHAVRRRRRRSAPRTPTRGWWSTSRPARTTPTRSAATLHGMRLAGWFDHARAVLVGRTPAPDADGLTQHEAVADALGGLGDPGRARRRVRPRAAVPAAGQRRLRACRRGSATGRRSPRCSAAAEADEGLRPGRQSCQHVAPDLPVVLARPPLRIS